MRTRRTTTREENHVAGRESSLPLHGRLATNPRDNPKSEYHDGDVSNLMSAATHEDINMGDAVGNNNGGSNNDAVDCFGSQSRNLIKAVQKLEELSINATLQSLPKFVVVGDQSHGKSSIIEAVCDITLPRSAGTCTRCPFQITTTSTEAGSSWFCTISLVYRAMYNPKRGGRAASPWKDVSEHQVVHFATVYERDTLERYLRLAQIAILNPHLNPQDVLREGNTERELKVSFSPNVVRLDVHAPDLPELSFFDLPGAINMVHDESEDHVVGLIENLIKRYVKDERTLVLLAISANQDVETSTAYRYVHSAKPDGRQTMGVLTKPDLITMDNRQLRMLLHGQLFKLEHGWYTAKQPSQIELDQGITHGRARERERAFFETQEPWVSFPEFKDRFGTKNLQAVLSKRLTSHILEELPNIMDRVHARLQEVDAELAKFPEQAKAPTQAVSREVDRLQILIARQLSGQGHGSDKKFRNEYKEAIRRFRSELADAMPELKMTSPGFIAPAINLDADSDGDNGKMEVDGSPSKTMKNNEGERVATANRQATTPRGPNSRSDRAPRTPIKSERHNALPHLKVCLTLDQLKKDYEYGSVSSDLPHQLDAGVTDNLSISFLRPWSDLVEGTLMRVKLLVGNMVRASIEIVLDSRKETKLFAEVISILSAQITEIMDEVTGHIRYSLACEGVRPITYDTDVNARVTEMRSSLTEKRKKVRVDEYFDNIESQTGRATLPADRAKRSADAAWVQSTLGSDSYTRELSWIAIPLTYYEVAAKRFIDNVATHLEYGLIRGLEKDLKDRLEEDLHVTDPQYCAELLAEDPAREQDRAQLLLEREKLRKALNELQGLPMMA